MINGSADSGAVEIHLHNDVERRTTVERVSQALADIIAYAHHWALETQKPDEPKREPTLRFSSLLAGMLEGADPLCAWLRAHMDLRGVARQAFTHSLEFPKAAIPGQLTTTHSFRQAFEQARKLHQMTGSQDGIGLRHFMAAYPIVPSYHLHDFLSLRIDRRAWCLNLAEYLRTHRPGEAQQWINYARFAPAVHDIRFEKDAPEGSDLLNIEREVEAFSKLIVSRATSTPLSIGVFGTWGSGKSFFMRRVRERVAELAAIGRKEERNSKYHGQTAQIEFNAWHYSEGNLIASLVDHIFRNLRFDKPDETEEELRKRSTSLLEHVRTSEKILVERKDDLDQAESRVTEAKQHVDEIDSRIQTELAVKGNELASAQSKLAEAQRKHASGLTELQNEIRRAVDAVPVTSVVGLLRDKLLNDPTLVKAGSEVRGVMQEAKRASRRGQAIFWGLVVFAVMALAAAIMADEAWKTITSAVAALIPFAAMAATWLKKLHQIADSGEQFQKQQAELAEKVTAEVTAAHAAAIEKLRAVANEQTQVVEKLQAELSALQQAPDTARTQLADLEKQRAEAAARHTEAAVEVERKKQALSELTSGRLLEEFLNQQVTAEGYLKELTIFSRVRNDFEKLSTLMTRAAKAYYDSKDPAPEPAVSRIVLYIDDLDRCPEKLVVDVLRVVHLLLAFPLFVCVVAVDPRWLTRCLRSAPGLISSNENFDAELGPPATTADYLEKIFQIPLWLRPIPVSNRPAIVRALLGAVEPESKGESTRRSADESDSRTAKDSAVEIAATAGSVVTRDASDAEELRYLDQLTDLLDGNPRALKRFVNTYRLVKTALSDVEFAVFLNPELRPNYRPLNYKPYCICMAQVAVLCTQRQRAISMVQLADATSRNKTIDEWLNSLAAENGNKEFALHLREALSATGDLKTLKIETFQLWLERTRRYSFYL